MSKVAVLINKPEQQYEGLRSSLGMLLYNTEVQMFVLNQEIANMDEAYVSAEWYKSLERWKCKRRFCRTDPSTVSW